MSSPKSTDADHVRQTLMKLSVAVRETTPAGAKQVSHAPNLLARPVYGGCRVCGLPGHQSADIQHPAACRVALLSLIGFWEVVADHVSFLYQYSERFQKAIQANEPTYAMRFDNPPLKGGDMEAVLVDRVRVTAAHFHDLDGPTLRPSLDLGHERLDQLGTAVLVHEAKVGTAHERSSSWTTDSNACQVVACAS